jgi:hypothetical protein
LPLGTVHVERLAPIVAAPVVAAAVIAAHPKLEELRETLLAIEVRLFATAPSRAPTF